ncbi:hypothetical protein [Streptomyces sp. CB01881]|uniref:hypothetical protein n=1 Tax=Streptomyces sp. CB01881 TaxID=2078691 RepID=UPI000CDCA016|nr:hypothetical protein [Streptomyces sp. CB01881]AUY50437.1 hypothetical protein C2142_17545 [Streptomyces sp. CB01881]TYC73824.1 hypothetical protein EH183_17525 [Streptomyces sp. CB01881]
MSTEPSPAADPGGCAHCGLPERGHARQWTEQAGWHAWVRPSPDQTRRRLQERRAARSDAPA